MNEQHEERLVKAFETLAATNQQLVEIIERDRGVFREWVDNHKSKFALDAMELALRQASHENDLALIKEIGKTWTPELMQNASRFVVAKKAGFGKATRALLEEGESQ